MCLVHPLTPKYQGSEALRCWLLQHSRCMALHKVKKLHETESSIKPLTRGAIKQPSPLASSASGKLYGPAQGHRTHVRQRQGSKISSKSATAACCRRHCRFLMLQRRNQRQSEAKLSARLNFLRGEPLRSPGAADGDGRGGNRPGSPQRGCGMAGAARRWAASERG